MSFVQQHLEGSGVVRILREIIEHHTGVRKVLEGSRAVRILRGNMRSSTEAGEASGRSRSSSIRIAHKNMRCWEGFRRVLGDGKRRSHCVGVVTSARANFPATVLAQVIRLLMIHPR